MRTPLAVASVPAGHSYVRHTSDRTTAQDFRVLPDPPVPGAPSGQWWPHRMLEPSWLRARHRRFDLLHLHFGYEHRTPDELRELVGTLRARGKPLVLTVHDLRNPHQADPAPHRAALDVLVPSADAVITLSRGAADRITAIWGRPVEVIPHPHVVDPERMRRVAGRGGENPFVIGVHAKSMRANCDAIAIAEQLAETVSSLPGAELSVLAHDDAHGLRAADELRRRGVAVQVRPPFSDAELFDYLESLDVSVLPHRFGTHSGWLEACYDLGTTVLAPDFGFYREQAPCLLYSRTETSLDPLSLDAAVRQAYTERPRWRADPGLRETGRIAIARAHFDVYRAVVNGR
ncbi:glycosyltransferase [Amycolatopsis sp. lyj-90]|uniref:glycosyltransferase n=1 Tax=unclassified Amycolatopsis TaxID=2618356 RepID=UPI003979BFD2